MKKKLTLWAALCMMLVCVMSVTAFAAGTATITQCIISGADQITVTATVSGVASEDGNLYLFEMKPYQNSSRLLCSDTKCTDSYLYNNA